MLPERECFFLLDVNEIAMIQTYVNKNTLKIDVRLNNAC